MCGKLLFTPGCQELYQRANSCELRVIELSIDETTEADTIARTFNFTFNFSQKSCVWVVHVPHDHKMDVFLKMIVFEDADQ